MAAFEDNLPYHAFGSRTLQLTSPPLTGTDVKVFQTLFNAFLAHAAPPQGPLGTPIASDGVFGPETERAVRQWQRFFGLQDDGVVGPLTGATLGQYDAAYGGPRFGSRDLGTGSQGGDVVVLQNRLNCLRYGVYVGHAGEPHYDAPTAEAVRHFQEDVNRLGIDRGVPVDGLVGFETFDALWSATFIGGRALFEGRHGIDTLWLQRFLASQGFYAGPHDGRFDPAVTAAVRHFQASLGLSVDGVVGARTMDRIGQAFDQPAGTWPSP